MTWPIAFVFLLLLAALVSFVWERIPADLTALAVLVVLLVTGLVPENDVLGVFANPAPITVGAMFVLSAALVKCGALDLLSGWIERTARWRYPLVMLALAGVVALLSAFVNNTPVVVVFLPITLNLARRMHLPASKLLIPLSYAAILGGTCTLIGTSTNLIVNGIAVTQGQPAFAMFELAWLGVPTTIIGALYLAFFGLRRLPVREMLTSILTAEERREYITEAFVQADSRAVGRTLAEAGLIGAKGVRVLEIVRDGAPLDTERTEVRLAAGDRLVLACRPKGIVHTRGLAGVDLVTELQLGLEQIAAHEGALVEGIVPPRSALVGYTVRESDFRRRFAMIVLAVHRKGQNLREHLDTLALEAGDVLLMMGTDQAIARLRQHEDVVLFDRPTLPARPQYRKVAWVLSVIGAVVGAATAGWVPIQIGALVGCVIICLTGCLKPKAAYRAVEWNILFLIFGMLALGLAMERTGAAAWLAQEIVRGVEVAVPSAYKAMAMLACMYLVTAVLTELLSNNAVAALMTPIALGVATALNANPRAYLVAVMFAASAAFSTPIGYQTNTYVYGVGGYRFSDFVKFGLPLNLLCFLMAMLMIPRLWPL